MRLREILVAFVATIAAVHAVDWDIITPLDKYVHSCDPFYKWKEISREEGDGYILHVLNMTSLKWKDETFTRQPIWWHLLHVFVPTAPVITDAMFLDIGGGGWSQTKELELDRVNRTAEFCRKLGVVAVYLPNVPFQPIQFVKEDGTYTSPKIEDHIIGYTWRLFVEAKNPDPEAVVLLPMTKAAKKAVDTVQDFVAEEYTEFKINKVFPTGFSKRGHVTWLLGCVDKRVFAMAPTVLALLNMPANFDHLYRALGGWSWAFEPYWLEGVAKYVHHPRLSDLAAIIDPYAYNERLTMPKLLIAATGDEFYAPDCSHYFWKGLTPPKFFRIYENDDHLLSRHLNERDELLQAFFMTAYMKHPLPEICWTRTENATHGIVTVQTNTSPLTVSGYYGNTTKAACDRNGCRRDFRIHSGRGRRPTGIRWYENDVEQTGINSYEVVLKKRDDSGYRGFFIKMTFPGPDGYTLDFTTEVNIIPDVFPYPRCTSETECQGRIV